jgi:plastocyanin
MQNQQDRQRRARTVLCALAVPVVALIAVVVTRVVAGPSDASAAPTKANAVVIKNFAFSPDDPTVARGSTIEITNDDGSTHTFSAKDGSFNTGELGGGKSKAVKVDRAGTFAFYCQIHTYMTGTLVVR